MIWNEVLKAFGTKVIRNGLHEEKKGAMPYDLMFFSLGVYFCFE